MPPPDTVPLESEVTETRYVFGVKVGVKLTSLLGIVTIVVDEFGSARYWVSPVHWENKYPVLGRVEMVDVRFELVRARSTGLTESGRQDVQGEVASFETGVQFHVRRDGEGDEVGFRIGKRMTVPSVEFPTQGGACVQVYGILKNRGERGMADR